MKKTLYAAMLFVTMLCSCGDKHDHADDAELQEAMASGREAAREIVSRQWKDTVELQRLILEVKARQSRYLMENRKECAEAFDSGFVSGVKAVNPSLAREIFK